MIYWFWINLATASFFEKGKNFYDLALNIKRQGLALNL